MYGKIRVLHVEDSPHDRALVGDALTVDSAGFAVAPAADRAEFTSALDQGAFDVVLSDFNILGFEGFEVFDAVRGRFPEMPFIYVTGTGTEEVAVEAMKRGADDYVIKSTQHIRRLPRTIMTVLERRAAVRERARVEMQLSQERHLLQTIVDHLPDRIYIKDLDSRFVFANRALLEALRVPDMAAVLGRTDADFHAPELAARFRADEQALVASGRALMNREERLEGPDGQERWSLTTKVPWRDARGQVVGLIGISREITELKWHQEEVQRLATAVEQASESVVITDLEGRIIYVNPSFEEVTGYTRAEALNEKPSILKSGEQDASFYGELWETIASGGVWRGRLINRRKDGSRYVEDAVISPIRNASGAIVSYVAVKREVSREVVLEQQLREAQKLEAIGTLAGGIAHDFNNILGAILGYAEMLGQSLPDAGRPREDLRQIEQAARRAQSLVSQILTFSRRAEEHREPVRLGEVLREALGMLRATLPANIAIDERIAVPEALVYADAAQMLQMAVNLCTNGYQAMRGGGGTLTVTLEYAGSGPIPVGATRELPPGDYVCFEVRDTGDGMDARTRDRLFEPFFTTKGPGEGTGLGLATVHGIVHGHGGAIHVESAPGAGSAFTVYLPRHAGVAAAAPLPAEAPPGGTERLLLVDDEPALVEVLGRSLERLGYAVTRFTDPEAAIAAFRAAPEKFDLVITDQTMPRMTGAELVRGLHALRPELPAILTTGYSESLSRAGARELGCAAFLIKPVAPRELAVMVRAALDARPRETAGTSEDEV